MKTGKHSDSLFEAARAVCATYEGDAEKVKAALALSGYDKQVVFRAMHQMRAEGRVHRSAELSRSQRYMRDAHAGVMHLIDLKRAGHSARKTEMNITPDTALGLASLRARRLRNVPVIASSAGMCADGVSAVRFGFVSPTTGAE